MKDLPSGSGRWRADFTIPKGKWCSERDSNPHKLPHTPLKRTRLPIPPPEHLNQPRCLLDEGTQATLRRLRVGIYTESRRTASSFLQSSKVDGTPSRKCPFLFSERTRNDSEFWQFALLEQAVDRAAEADARASPSPRLPGYERPPSGPTGCPARI